MPDAAKFQPAEGSAANSAAGVLRRYTTLLIVIGILAVAVAPLAPSVVRVAGAARFRASGPDLTLWFSQPWTIQIHVYSALAALAIGMAILLRRKGGGLHKTLGWAWVIAMATTAVSSLFITGLNGGFYSLIHLISGWTLIALPMAIYAIRNRKAALHQRAMTGVFVGGLLIAGTLSFLPGRLMWNVFFG